ncbi:enteropeptidase-like protein [Dinothrombium tinctorium]|uniref:Enteropeptidase-like protein n=1 Tax=Dinothrombium tinctorium TaxID=1965070 RepID=A0A3S3NV10_9ACAR|nr:enteropeptidase-like protein [Dinothrombium tinctorium]RWR99502.1 enteropeptidase-like protein [Dinothrombium tinctorium]RWR99503.1 enteropeptidase-like protein [Dinothrombium tinctorium]RWR99525.1 enteropeptidase-like protein [Dinothrombium tinctorium]
MDKPVDFAGNEWHLRPACLDLSGLEKNLDTQNHCIATGFGRLDDSTFPDLLQQIDMKLYDHDKCASMYPKGVVTDKQICMVSKHNPQPLSRKSYGNPCFGDSGGPLQCFINNNWIQLGITWGAIDCERSPSVFQKIYKYAEFIKNTSSYKLPTSCKALSVTKLLNSSKNILLHKIFPRDVIIFPE